MARQRKLDAALIKALWDTTELNTEAYERAYKVIGQAGDYAHVFMLRMLYSSMPEISYLAMRVLRRMLMMEDKHHQAIWQGMLGYIDLNQSSDLRLFVLKSLLSYLTIRPKSVLYQDLAYLVWDENIVLAGIVVDVLGTRRDRQFIPHLISLLDDCDSLAHRARRALEQIGGSQALYALMEWERRLAAHGWV